MKNCYPLWELNELKKMKTRTQKTPIWFKTLTSFFTPKKTYKKKALPKPKAGIHHNLNELFSELNSQYFENSLAIPVEWSGSGITSSRSVVRLGYYSPRKKLIKISRILDYPHVPKFFVSFILYHEILHHILPPYRIGLKRKIHHSEFKQKEREFQEYEQSQAFLKDFKKELFAPKQRKRNLPCKTP
jgi:hypothetical protein